MKQFTRLSIGCILSAAVALGGLHTDRAAAYPRWQDGCYYCHGDFDGPVSPKGTVFPGDSKHLMHRGNSYMNIDCDLCHTTDGQGGRTQHNGSSNGTANNPGVGCTGCHGRDYGGSIGNSAVGLRAHHAAHSVTICATCHQGEPEPLPEDVKPTYYGTADTNVDDPCNLAPDNLENWSIGDSEGLDNDGDDAYDENDSDCTILLGDMNCRGTVDMTDVPFFVEALLLADPGDWPYLQCDILHGDFDGSGGVDGPDIQGLVAALTE